MRGPEITATSLFGSGAAVPMAVSPYGVGLDWAGGPAAAPQAASSAPAGMMGLLPDFIPNNFWEGSGFGLILLVGLVLYFDIRLLN